MTDIANLIRRTDTMGVRDTEYRAFSLLEGLTYQYTELHSDGIRAIKVRLDRTVNKDNAFVTVWFARVDDAETMGDVLWTELPHVNSPAFTWHPHTVSYSHWSVPSNAVVVIQDLVNRAMKFLVWDSE